MQRKKKNEEQFYLYENIMKKKIRKNKKNLIWNSIEGRKCIWKPLSINCRFVWKK